MKQIFLVLKREYLTRVKKKSFLLATILTPLIFPALIFGIIYLSSRDSGDIKEVFILDESGLFDGKFTDNSYEYKYLEGSLDDAKKAFQEESAYGLLYIPEVDFSDASQTRYGNFAFYSETNLGLQVEERFEGQIRKVLEDVKLEKSGLDASLIESLRASVDMDTFNLSDTGEEKESNSGLSFGVGYVFGFLIYMFIFIYGSQIMQSVLDEKTSRIVEVIVSSVRPFQLMMGKVLGVGAVGFTQLLIWIVLMVTLTTVGFSAFGPSAEMMASGMSPEAMELSGTEAQVMEVQNMLGTIPVTKIVISFLFYFIGAYLLYGALYAAVGSAVDSLQDAQQFMFPVMLPILISIFALMVVIQDPHSTMAVWLSMIPFTSPIVMMGRLPFGVPTWQLLLSMVLLIFGFIGTIWAAGRIYRIGILMYGVKVNWKTLKVWFTMKV
ncbi:MAG: ABC transporter permease [Roseivirga sp.]